jgi:hypothetical protein
VPTVERQAAVSIPTPPAFKRLLLGVPRPKASSQVRLRALVAANDVEGEDAAQAQAHHLLDELGDEQLNLSMCLVTLETAVELIPYDPSAQAAANTVRSRLDELGELRDALQRVHFACAYPSAASLLHNDAALADYLRGIYAWLRGVVRALEFLAVELRQLGVDWGSFRARLDAARSFFLMDLAESIRLELARAAALAPDADGPELVEELAADLEDVFACGEWFATSIRLRFG